MDPIRGSSAYNVQGSGSANPAQAAQAAQAAVGPHLSGHANSLIAVMLSDHTMAALNAKEKQGNEREKMLVGFTKQALSSSGQLQLSPDQPAHGDARFGIRRNQDVLVVIARLNENDRSKYDVLNVGFRRGSGAPVSMTLPGPSTAAARTAQPPSALLGLPNELLLQITANTCHRGKRANLSLRQVSKQMRDIVDRQMSPKQRFLAQNGQNLHAAGYSRNDMNDLFARPAAERDFVLTHGPQLRANGYKHAFYINDLAARPAAEREFVLTYAQQLHAAGYDQGINITRLASRPADQRDFILNNAKTLQAVGYKGMEMNGLAAMPADARDFVLTHAQQLRANGYIAQHINTLAMLPAAARDFALTHAQKLHANGYNYGFGINQVAVMPAAERDFVLNNVQKLHAAGYDSRDVTKLAKQPADERDFVLNNAQKLQAVGYKGEEMNRLAAMPADARDFVLTHAQQLRANGYNSGYEINALAAQPYEREAFLRQIGHRS